MARIEWDKSGERFYETGVDRGVLYPKGALGIPWNGLVSVTPDNSSATVKSAHLDGIKYENRILPSEFKATIEAFTYPVEFSNIIGETTSGSGVHFGQQPPVEFNMSYRTTVSNDVGDRHYKIHLIYNALATSKDNGHSSMNDEASPTNFIWEITTRGIIVSGRAPSAELVIDSRYADPSKFRYLQNIIYGYQKGNPWLPSIETILDIFDDWPFIQINPKSDGLHTLSYRGLRDLKGNNRKGLYHAPPETRLVQHQVPGLYKLVR